MIKHETRRSNSKKSGIRAFCHSGESRNPVVSKRSIGVGKLGCPSSPPSEPDVRFSRIRLSSRWLSSRGLKQSAMGIIKAKIPKVPKVIVWPANNQAEPNTSFHPVFQGLQHVLCPHRTFHLAPFSGACISCLFSPFGHCRRSVFVRCGPHTSISLRPFAPGALPPFQAPMDALTPARPLPLLPWQIERRPFNGQGSPVHTTLPSMHSVTRHLTCPIIAFPLPAQRDGLPGHFAAARPFTGSGSYATPLARGRPRSGLHLESAGSSHRTAESCSSSYGLHVRLRLLSTPPRGDAVTFGYRERASPGRGLSPLRLRLLPGARIPAFAAMTNGIQ